MKHSSKEAAFIYSLGNTPIFSGLANEQLAQIATYSTSVLLQKGDCLFQEKDPVKGFYIVRKGIINIYRESMHGREQVIHLFRSGESFAEASLLSTQGYPANARAETNSEVLLIPKEAFMQHQKEQPELAWRIFASMSQRLHMLVSTVENLRLKDAETRLLHWLLHRCPLPPSSSPVQIELEMQKSLLAAELSTRHETLSRIFAKLRDQGIIQIQNKTITISNPKNLLLLFEKNLTQNDEEA